MKITALFLFTFITLAGKMPVAVKGADSALLALERASAEEMAVPGHVILDESPGVMGAPPRPESAAGELVESLHAEPRVEAPRPESAAGELVEPLHAEPLHAEPRVAAPPPRRSFRIREPPRRDDVLAVSSKKYNDEHYPASNEPPLKRRSARVAGRDEPKPPVQQGQRQPASNEPPLKRRSWDEPKAQPVPTEGLQGEGGGPSAEVMGRQQNEPQAQPVLPERQSDADLTDQAVAALETSHLGSHRPPRREAPWPRLEESGLPIYHDLEPMSPPGGASDLEDDW